MFRTKPHFEKETQDNLEMAYGIKVRIFFQCDPESLQHFIVFFNLCSFVALKDNTMNWKVIC